MKPATNHGYRVGGVACICPFRSIVFLVGPISVCTEETVPLRKMSRQLTFSAASESELVLTHLCFSTVDRGTCCETLELSKAYCHTVFISFRFAAKSELQEWGQY